MGIQIDLDKCVGCGDCLPSCPFGLLEIVDEKVHLKDGCTFCGACQEACDYQAITVEVITETLAPGDRHKGVWVFAEQRDGRVKSVAYELLSKGRELADTLKTELCAICFGHDIGEGNFFKFMVPTLSVIADFRLFMPGKKEIKISTKQR